MVVAPGDITSTRKVLSVSIDLKRPTGNLNVERDVLVTYNAHCCCLAQLCASASAIVLHCWPLVAVRLLLLCSCLSDLCRGYPVPGRMAIAVADIGKQVREILYGTRDGVFQYDQKFTYSTKTAGRSDGAQEATLRGCADANCWQQHKMMTQSSLR